MGARRHRSKREELAGMPRRAANNPSGNIGHCPQLLVYVDKLNSRKRSDFIRLCRLHNVSLKWEEWREGRNQHNQAIKIGMIGRIWGNISGMQAIASWIDTTLNVHSELCIASAIPRALGSGKLSQGAERRGRMNKSQKREWMRDSQYQKKADRADRADRKSSEALSAFNRAYGYAVFLQSLPENERKEIERRNVKLAELAENAPKAAPFVPEREAVRKPVDCGKLRPLVEPTLIERSADALTMGLKEYWYSVVESRRIEADKRKLEQW